MLPPLKTWLVCSVLLVATSNLAYPQAENDVVINEVAINPASGKEYVELLVLASSVNMQGWTISDANTRGEGTGGNSGDTRLPQSASYLANVPLGTYVVIELSTPSGNASTLTEDLSLSDATPRLLIIKRTTSGVTTSGTTDWDLSDNIGVYAGTRASGAIIDEILWGTSQGYISGASWGDNNSSTITDNINSGVELAAGSYNLRFMPADQSSWTGFRADNINTVWTITPDSYGAPGSVNEGVAEPPLPVQLASFTGGYINGGRVLLQWLTLTEINNYGFEIQRRSAQEYAFVTLSNGFVQGHGTTLQPQRYSFTDATVTPGQWFYRLKQIDLDGAVHYTDPISIDVLTGINDEGRAMTFALEQNYPNPFNPSTLIQYSLPTAEHVSLRVYNLMGQEVMTVVDEIQGAGMKTVTLDASRLTSGAYLYRLTAGSFSETKRLVLMK